LVPASIDKPSLNPACVAALPPPLCSESFALLKRGVFDDPAIDVYVNGAGDFALLVPVPTVDYGAYRHRHQTLGLTGYRKARRVMESRYAKIERDFAGARSVLEIGAAEGAFLSILRASRPELLLAAIEPDQSTRAERDAIPGLRQFATLGEAADAGLAVDVVCLFHVFEHLIDPAGWLASAKRVIAPGGRLIIEVPSLDDPLLSLYGSAPYREFYFQKQHPYVYSAKSLRRVLEHHGFSVEVVPYQRYGMENHLTWLSAGKPGGSAEYRDIFARCEVGYAASLEARGLTDTVFAIARVAI
jgi:SAM-dependent methyltransferase